MYNPEKDTQRYCVDCDAWFDLECLGAKFSVAAISDLKERIAAMPVVRGDLGSGNDAWRIVGSGRAKRLMCGWIQDGVFPEDWEEQLGESFLEFMESVKEFHWYECPSSCPSRI